MKLWSMPTLAGQPPSISVNMDTAGVFDGKHATEQKYEWLLRPSFKLLIHPVRLSTTRSIA